MPLVVEGGTGLADAEAYASVAAFKAYCAKRGISVAELTDTDIEQRLRKGADWLTGQYRGRWAGVRKTVSQALDFPRYNVPMRDAPSGYGAGYAIYPEDEVPEAVVNANIEVAIRAGEDLNPDLERGVLSESVAGVVSVTYDPKSPQQVRYPAVEAMLAPLLRGSGVRLVRG